MSYFHLTINGGVMSMYKVVHIMSGKSTVVEQSNYNRRELLRVAASQMQEEINPDIIGECKIHHLTA
jgi:hypothetical protein|tara:strand:- start:75 stop:275 length:201 start_codon:yes stop_codon:yes gene_type:complete